MKPKFTEHSANERTFLAWIRTAIAIMAFGFLVEKFTLFLDYISVAMKQPPMGGGHAAATLGFALIVLGVAMIIVSTLRFKLIEREIDKDDPIAASLLPDFLLAILLVLISLFLLIYLGNRVFVSPTG